MLAKSIRALGLAFVFGSLSQAGTFVYVLDELYTSSSAIPAGYPVITISDVGLPANTVNIGISLANLASSEFIRDLVLNYDPLKNANLLNIAPANPAQLPPTTITWGNNLPTPSHLSIGRYDLLFAWANSGVNRFNGPEVLNFTVTIAAGNTLTAADFNHVSEDDGFYGATHIQGIANGEGSIKVSSTGRPPSDPPGVPEPASMALVATGGAALLLFGRKRSS